MLVFFVIAIIVVAFVLSACVFGIQAIDRELKNGRAKLDCGWGEYYAGFEKYSAGLQEYKSGKIQLREGWSEYNKKNKWYVRLFFNKKLESGLRLLKDGEKRLCDGEVALKEGELKLKSGLAQLQDGEAKYAKGMALQKYTIKAIKILVLLAIVLIIGLIGFLLFVAPIFALIAFIVIVPCVWIFALKIIEVFEKPINILIIGKTGVGKSTIINKIAGKKVAETGSGKPITQEIQKCEINDKITIFDSQGIEVANYQSTKEKIEKFLSQNATKECDKMIHIAWFCIAESGRRIENADLELWKMLQDYKVPILIIITKAEQDKDEHRQKFSEIVQKAFGVNGRQIVRIRALEITDDYGKTKKAMGIKELLKKTRKMQKQTKN